MTYVYVEVGPEDVFLSVSLSVYLLACIYIYNMHMAMEIQIINFILISYTGYMYRASIYERSVGSWV